MPSLSPQEISPEIAAQVGLLYEALKNCSTLLRVGRRHGFRVGLSAPLAELLREVHGAEASSVVSNCLPVTTPDPFALNSVLDLDVQALTDLHASLQAQGFQGDMATSTRLLVKASDDTQKRIAMSYWLSAGLPEQAALVARVFAYAQKHRMRVLCTVNRPGQLTLTGQGPGTTVRLAHVNIDGDGARLLFTKEGDFVGERNIGWS